MAVKLKNISLKYRRNFVIKNLHLEVGKGEVISLLGPSGVGKTTLLKIIAGLEPNYSGSVAYSEGNSLSDTILVFQDYWLFRHMTVKENLAFGLKVKKVDKDIIEKKVAFLISQLDLKGLENVYPDHLSGGQKQRVAIGRGIILEPKLLLLDEPFASLDANLRISTRRYLLSLQKKYQFSILLVTHDKEEAFQLSDRIAVILDGEVAQIASPKRLYYKPKTNKVAAFINETNELKGTCQGAQFSLAGNDGDKLITVENPCDVNGTVNLQIPFGEAFYISQEPIEGADLNNVLFEKQSGGYCAKGKVTSVSWQPSGEHYTIEIGQQECYFSNIKGQASVGEWVYLTTMAHIRWQVMAE